MSRPPRVLARTLVSTLGLAAAAAFAEPVQVASIENLADLALEDLVNIRVITTALRPQRFLDAPASVFVITGEDIRHAGATSLPEALRLAPNLEVAHVGSSAWAVSARGFQNVITNKMLVLLDGRTLYTSVLSGVLWDAQDVMLEDVDRIEVISGPGAALYGANAFSGVINIITHASRDTQGLVASASSGRYESNAALRYGGKLGERGTYRAYAMHIDRDDLRPFASQVPDAMRKDQVGFRADLDAWGGTLTVQGDAFDATESGNGAPDVQLNGGNLLARWMHEGADGTSTRVQAYYDHTKRDDPLAFRDRLDTLDVEAQQDLAARGAHHISYGVGYRYAWDDTTPTPVVRFLPEDRHLHWASVFAQDEIALGHDFSVTLGARAQTTVYVRPEVMPDLRLAWKPSAQAVAWAAVSRVARTPGRVDRDLFVPGNPPFAIKGSPDFRSEIGTVYEIGYRAQPNRSLTYSVTAFLDQLDDLRSGRPAPGGGAFISNEVEGRTTGIEAWAMYQATARWRLTAGWLELRQDLHAKNGSGSLVGPANLGNDPRHTVKLRSAWRPRDDVDVDLSWRYVSALSYSNVSGYDTLDARIAWRPRKDLELALVGKDLLQPDHVEFNEHGFPAAIPRSAFVQVRWEP